MNPGQETPSSGPITATGPLRILLADDEDSVRVTVKMILESQFAGSTVIEAISGRDAVEIANTQFPEVILMDIKMPGVGGFDAARQILAVQPNAKIIMFSGYRSRELIKQARESGSVGYLFKPCKPDELVHAIREVLSGQLVFPVAEPA